MKRLIRDITTIEFLNTLNTLNKRLYTEDVEVEWALALKRVNRRLKQITTGRTRYIYPNQYTGTGEVRIKELNDASIAIQTFHSSSLDAEYIKNETLVSFDRIEVMFRYGNLSLMVFGLRGPVNNQTLKAA